jgi:LCP family protein required for cell wall assembly
MSSSPSPLESTQPSRSKRSLSEYQPIRISLPKQPEIRRGEHRRIRIWPILLIVGLLVYLLFPFRSNILILGSDYAPHRNEISRTDTIILTTVTPYYLGMLSIPRDLWVPIPGVGENRINTAYFFAEAAQRGTGPAAAMDTIRANFGVNVDHYFLLNMGGLVEMVDALGGVDITLDKPMGGLEAGKHHLDGTKALAFSRERYSADDFSRMKQGQIMARAMLSKVSNPLHWFRLPAFGIATVRAIQTDVPFWLWPRLAVALGRAAIMGVDGRTITREMVNPFTTDGGAQVLAPDWLKINPVLQEIFGQ